MSFQNDKFQAYKGKLEGAKLKATHQRIVIYAALVEMNSHPSAEDIFEHLRITYPSLSLGTVYRTLDCFIQSGLLQRVSNREGKLLFDCNTELHHLKYDMKSRRIVDFVDPELNTLIEGYLNKKGFNGFTVADYQLQVFGEFV